jgi:hypothetical protein
VEPENYIASHRTGALCCCDPRGASGDKGRQGAGMRRRAARAQYAPTRGLWRKLLLMGWDGAAGWRGEMERWVGETPAPARHATRRDAPGRARTGAGLRTRLGAGALGGGRVRVLTVLEVNPAYAKYMPCSTFLHTGSCSKRPKSSSLYSFSSHVIVSPTCHRNTTSFLSGTLPTRILRRHQRLHGLGMSERPELRVTRSAARYTHGRARRAAPGACKRVRKQSGRSGNRAAGHSGRQAAG